MVIQGARHHPSRRLRPQRSRLLQRVYPRKGLDSVKEPVWRAIEWFSLRFLLILQSLQLNSLLAVRFFQMGSHEPSNTISNSNPTAALTHPSRLLPLQDALQLPIIIR